MKKLHQKLFVILLMVLVIVGCKTTYKRESKAKIETVVKKPNILFLLTDDQSFSAINSLGNKEVYTPNMDKLVNNGTSFTHAHIMGSNSGAVCLPSRAMLMTGRYVQNLAKVSEAIETNDKTMPEVLKSAGCKFCYGGCPDKHTLLG